MPRRKDKDLKEACLKEALAIVESKGLEHLSMRAVARKLGVSHQAPYKHFESREHILAELVARAYENFADFLEARPRSGDPDQELREMGLAYFRYALSKPLPYRLMFGTPLPDPHEHPHMMKNAQHAYHMLKQAIRRVPDQGGEARSAAQVELDALFIWSTLHGLATILRSHALETLELNSEMLRAAIPETLNRMGLGIAIREPG